MVVMVMLTIVAMMISILPAMVVVTYILSAVTTVNSGDNCCKRVNEKIRTF